MSDDQLTYFEKRLLAEIEIIEQKTKHLKDEKFALQRQLAKARAERAGIKMVTRKNSANRVLAENTILAALRSSEKSLKTQDLYQKARRTNFELKEVTFRTYLHRMKKRGEITTTDRSGYWKLLDNSKE